MTAVRFVTIQCDECEEYHDGGIYHENAVAARAEAQRDGWMVHRRASKGGGPGSTDVCPECREVPRR